MNAYDPIETVASNFRKKMEDAFSFEGDVSDLLSKIVHALKGEIKVISNPSQYEVNGGSLRIKEDGTFVIYLPPSTSPLRDNFTIAHELGHYFLHYSGKGACVFLRYGNNTKEIEANRFAAAFLMPKDDFLKFAKLHNNSSYLLAMKFQVSEQAASIRLKSLQDE